MISPAEQQVKKQYERLSTIVVFAFAAVLTFAFFHVVNWGSYSLEVIPLEVTEWIGSTSPHASERLAEICLEVKRFDCVEKMYLRSAQSDFNGYGRLGKFQFSRKRYAEAAESYRQLFVHGSRDIDAAFTYARALGEIGNVREATRYFDFVLASNPKVLPVTVAHTYVKFLVDHGELDQALKVIDKIRRRDTTIAQFMDSEYKVIRERLGKSQRG